MTPGPDQYFIFQIQVILRFSQNIPNISQGLFLSLCCSQVLLLVLFHLQACAQPAWLTCPTPSLRPCVSENLFPPFPHQSCSFSSVGQSLYPEFILLFFTSSVSDASFRSCPCISCGLYSRLWLQTSIFP